MKIHTDLATFADTGGSVIGATFVWIQRRLRRRHSSAR